MAFAFAEKTHEYFLEGVRIPSISHLLEMGGLVNSAWFSEKAAARGTEVHRLCADVDLGALDPADYQGEYQGYLQAHVKATKALNPVWEHIETAFVNPKFRYAGRPDRVGRVFGVMSVLDTKSGGPTDAHPIQTALQAVLVADEVHLPPVEIGRFVVYLSRTGSYRVQRHEDRRDFDRAYELLRRFAG
jgi:hypothetical protein